MELKQRVRNIRKKHANEKVQFNFGAREIVISRNCEKITVEEISLARDWYKRWLSKEGIRGEDPPGDIARTIVQRMLEEISFVRTIENDFIIKFAHNAWTIRREDHLPLTIYG